MADNKVTRIYSNFRGVDFRGEDGINISRSPDSLNMWRDYQETGSITNRPKGVEQTGLDLIDDTIYGIYFFKDNVLVHSGFSLIEILPDGTNRSARQGSRQGNGAGFVFEDKFYFLDGHLYSKYGLTKLEDGSEDYRAELVEGYIPTTSIGRTPSGKNEVSQDVNLLSNRRINTFRVSKDNTETDFYLDAEQIEVTSSKALDWAPIIVKTINVKEEDSKIFEIGTDYTVDEFKGIVQFKTAPKPPAYLTEGQDYISVEFYKEVDRDKIFECTMAQIFDNRVFFTGNPNYQNVIFHSRLYDPTYFSDLDYYYEGFDKSKITGMVSSNNALLVFREPSDENATIFYHTSATDEEYGRIYPNSSSNISIGCIGKAINFNDDIVFFSDRGMEGISGDITTEQVLGHRSTMVDAKMLEDIEKYKKMQLAEWQGYLLVFIGNKVFVADSRAMFTNENHVEYDWFYWDLSSDGILDDEDVTATGVKGERLYVGTSKGRLFVFDKNNQGDGGVECWWTTPKDKFSASNRLKTTNKRGCVVEAKGDVTVFAKTEDSDYEEVGQFNAVQDYFSARVKRKKFKDIQLKFYSKTGFTLEAATLEAYICGYIKR